MDKPKKQTTRAVNESKPASQSSARHLVLSSLLAVLISSYLFLAYPYYKTWTHRDVHMICAGSDGTIHTVDGDLSQPECFAVKKKRFSAIGKRTTLSQQYPNAQITTLGAKSTIIPGLHDSHAHLMQFGFSLATVDLVGATSVSECVDRIRQFALERNDDIIYGGGWDQTKWPGETNFPTATDLDADPILRGKGIVLYRVDFHVLWVNGKILDMLGDLPDTVDGGEIIRPLGCFLDNAVDLVLAKLPPWTDAQKTRYLAAAVEQMHSHGLVGLHDAMVSPQDLAFYKAAVDQGTFAIRMYAMLYCGVNVFCEAEKLHNYGDDRLTMRSVKLFGDGALGSWGAAMIDKYDDNEGSGFLRSEEHVFRDVIHKWISEGYQVNSHCIGDLANRVILDAYEQEGITAKDRFRIEHAQIMTLDDIERVGRLGIIASVQPTHATSDMGYAELRIGSRIRGAYAWKSLINASAIVTLGSDFPVEPVSPLEGIHAAVTRTSPRTDTSPHGLDGWYPEQRLTRLEALKGFTIIPAYASFHEKEYGSIEVGKRADFVVLSDDLLHERVAAKEIRKLKVMATVLDGQIVYGSL